MTQKEFFEQIVSSRPEIIICAAVHFDDGKKYVYKPINIETGYVICGHRHHECFYTRAIFGGEQGFEGTITQGFLTSKNRFLDRKEAYRLAKGYMEIYSENESLYSEDLY